MPGGKIGPDDDAKRWPQPPARASPKGPEGNRPPPRDLPQRYAPRPPPNPDPRPEPPAVPDHTPRGNSKPESAGRYHARARRQKPRPSACARPAPVAQFLWPNPPFVGYEATTHQSK